MIGTKPIGKKKIINQLVEEGKFSRDMLYAELGEVVSGKKSRKRK